jgi:hypothetical protein
MGINDPQAVALNPMHAPALVKPTAHLWLIVEMHKVAAERRPTSATVAAHERLKTLLVDLSDLVAAADRCAISARQQSIRGNGRGRGGKGREGPTPEVTLLHALFETYTALRHQYPNSGPGPAFGAPLIAFVRAGLALAVSSPPPIIAADGKTYVSAEKIYGGLDLAKESRTTYLSIRAAFKRWREQSTVQKASDLSIARPD